MVSPKGDLYLRGPHPPNYIPRRGCLVRADFVALLLLYEKLFSVEGRGLERDDRHPLPRTSPAAETERQGWHCIFRRGTSDGCVLYSTALRIERGASRIDGRETSVSSGRRSMLGQCDLGSWLGGTGVIFAEKTKDGKENPRDSVVVRFAP